MPETARSPTASADLSATGPAKLKEVTRLVDTLTADLDKVSLLPHQRDAHLDALKIFGRDPSYADPIFTKRGIETLTRHAFDSPSNTTSRNALRCLANAMLLNQESRQIFVDLGYEAKVCEKLRNDNRDDEFLAGRVIFLTTYGTTINIEKLIDEHHVADIVCTNIARHAQQYANEPTTIKEMNPMEDMSLNESLKLMYNLINFCPQRNRSFSPALQPILTILLKRPIPASKPLDPPIKFLLSALMLLDYNDPTSYGSIFPKSDPNTNVMRLLEILDMSIKAYTKGEEIEMELPPLLKILLMFYPSAPASIKSIMQSRILPSEEDRKQVLGQASTTSGRMLKMSNNPVTPNTRVLVSELLFKLSDENARKFVENVGYGFASGYLMSKNLSVPQDAMETTTIGSGQEGHQRQIPINPITGQRLDAEPQVEMPEMTQEEKEREAERLFVLFERLRATGVMNVQNPVTAAAQEGRFQELDDDDESD
ncbi:hypothetical protein BP6252_01693 [Coleophoma cylindrospora]|uniref:Synembryn n=1 Tax=Coleophoma cylindrospora TaxID=1849047 RepID=A0A3D8SU07_9HELO|nr:hypothetical protein BP6252_01693 [Coleophoma cylindrospora]